MLKPVLQSTAASEVLSPAFTNNCQRTKRWINLQCLLPQNIPLTVVEGNFTKHIKLHIFIWTKVFTSLLNIKY